MEEIYKLTNDILNANSTSSNNINTKYENYEILEINIEDLHVILSQ